MTFKQIYYRVFLRKEQVRNVPNSPSYQGSLIQDWESYKGRIALKCARCGKDLMQDDKVGGHVLKVPGISIDYYVVPLCKVCNHPSIKNHTLSPFAILQDLLISNETNELWLT